jgi:excisionase family DNA binding protein
MAGLQDIEPPSAADAAMAGRSAARLERFVRRDRSLRLAPESNGETVELPGPAAELLLRVLREMASGHAVTLIPIHAELSTQQAADVLGVSRPFLIGLLEKKAIPFRMVGTHRRVLFKDLLAYRRASEADRTSALDELADEAQRHGMGY